MNARAARVYPAAGRSRHRRTVPAGPVQPIRRKTAPATPHSVGRGRAVRTPRASVVPPPAARSQTCRPCRWSCRRLCGLCVGLDAPRPQLRRAQLGAPSLPAAALSATSSWSTRRGFSTWCSQAHSAGVQGWGYNYQEALYKLYGGRCVKDLATPRPIDFDPCSRPSFPSAW